MKKLLTKTLILVFGLGVATTFTACHSGENSTEIVTNVTPKHSISGTILTADGQKLSGATVKINGTTVTVTDNTFSRVGLADGSYTIEITRSGYKSVSDNVVLALQTVNETVTAQNIDKTYYLPAEVTSDALNFGTKQTGDEITIETTDQTDADGAKANDTNESIYVEAVTPEVTGDPTDPTSDLGDVNKQIMDQVAQLEAEGKETNGVKDVNDFKITLTNITSLEDAQAVARANKIAASRMTRATTEMPDKNELLAGVAVNAGPYVVTLPSGKTFTVTIKMPDEVKGAITLFRTFTGDKWTKIDMNNPQADGIKSIDTKTAGVIKIELTKVQTQSFGFGVSVTESTSDERWEDVAVTPIVNGATARSVSAMPYTINTGVVLTQSTKTALTDFLRKIVVRKYGTRIVKAPKPVNKIYTFSPAYQMHANGTLYLTCWQIVTETKFGVENATASFTATEYGDAVFAPYEVWEEAPIVHGGGSN